MKVSEVVSALERLAPPALAAEWDNVGLLVGDGSCEVRKLLLCIDLTEAVLAEAAKVKAAMVMAYHPVIFKPIARVTAEAAPVVYEAARCGLAVYSMHTAWDAAAGGADDVLADAMGLADRRALVPATGRGECKIVVFVPPADLAGVSEAAFEAGAGRIGGYNRCAFFSHGIGSFCGGASTHPTVGRAGRDEAVEELRLEMIAPLTSAPAVCDAIRSAHSYEMPAIDVYPLAGLPAGCGLGRVGRLARPATLEALVVRVKRAVGVRRALLARPSGHVRQGRIGLAACGVGAGRGVYRQAIAAGAGLFVTGEMPHHDALTAAAAGVAVLCLGHSNTERIALSRLAEQLALIAPKLKVVRSAQDRDPYDIV
ncbi:MAG: Nif3-like dinuclear metal center hexameric protein [Phycisphaerae bacterium]|nr:Nif3-like dinuclear metal center hexameric protein [Phycisphaerae bacterium]